MKTTLQYFLVLDIETSTKYEKKIVDNVEKDMPALVWLSYGWIKLYDIKNNTIDKLYFREWKDLRAYFMKVSCTFINKKVLCFVHNLSYEFDFIMKNICVPDKILSNSTHKVISSSFPVFSNIEFRCTYQISMQALKKIGHSVNLEKLESDYRCILPEENPTQKEIDYCERDCDIVAKYVVDVLLPKYTLSQIPYTKTGIVRAVFKKYYAEETDKTWDLMPDENCYQALCDAFQGAITISNPLYTGLKLKNVHSYDEASEYPSIMLKEKFPFTIKKLDVFSQDEYNKHNFYIMKVRFNGISSKYQWSWLSKSKMHDYDVRNSVFYNGKIIESPYIVRTITNIDFEVIKKSYVYESMEIIEFYACDNYDYLPNCFIKTIFHFAEPKYNLKKVIKSMSENDDKFLEIARDYMQAKNDFNSIYGMTVQKLISPKFIINELFEWKEKTMPYKQDEKIHLKRNFLYGIFITSYARRNLINGIIKNCPYTFVYADTDSIKFIGDNKSFVDTNSDLPEKYNSIPFLHNLGKFDYEGMYEEFLTYGAKKYAYISEGVCHPVVAGLPKRTLENLDEFRLGKIFYDCKNAKMYITNDVSFAKINDCDDCESEIIPMSEEIKKFKKEHHIITNGGVALFPVNYKLDITEEDKFYINTLRKDIKEWVKKYSQMSGTDLTKYLDIMQATRLL